LHSHQLLQWTGIIYIRLISAEKDGLGTEFMSRRF